MYVSVPEISGFTNVNTVVRNNFQDVFSIRLGGAANFRTGGSGVFTLRGGGYYESSATLPADTRLDFNTLEKWGTTLGMGFSYRGVGLNVAFAEIYSPSRVVINGDIAPVNPAQHGQSINASGNPFPAVNNGTYSASIQMVSFGLRVEIETLLGTNRSKGWSLQGTRPYDMPIPSRPPPRRRRNRHRSKRRPRQRSRLLLRRLLQSRHRSPCRKRRQSLLPRRRPRKHPRHR